MTMYHTAQNHFFRDENDNRTHAVTSQLPDGSYEAELISTHDGELEQHALFGHGATRMEAIANLQEQMDLELNQ